MTCVTRCLTFPLPACASLSPSRVTLGLSRSLSHFRRLPGCGQQSMCLCLWVSVSPSLGVSAQPHMCPSLPLEPSPIVTPRVPPLPRWLSPTSRGPLTLLGIHSPSRSLTPRFSPCPFLVSGFWLSPSPPLLPPLSLHLPWPPLSLYSHNSPLFRTPEITGVRPSSAGSLAEAGGGPWPRSCAFPPLGLGFLIWELRTGGLGAG